MAAVWLSRWVSTPMTASTLPSSMGTCGCPPLQGGDRGRRRPGCKSPRGRTVRGHDPSRVGQASDQASDVVGQAGARQLEGTSRQGTSQTAGYEWATRATGVSLPCQAATKATGSIVEDGRLRSEPLSLPAPTRSGTQAGTPDSITGYEPGHQGQDTGRTGGEAGIGQPEQPHAQD